MLDQTGIMVAAGFLIETNFTLGHLPYNQSSESTTGDSIYSANRTITTTFPHVHKKKKKRKKCIRHT